jgi:hypothetical protein
MCGFVKRTAPVYFAHPSHHVPVVEVSSMMKTKRVAPARSDAAETAPPLSSRTVAADMRADIARFGLQRYRVAARVALHPSTLGEFLNERRPFPAELVARVREAIKREAGA